jgi:glycosyltransferase involved in cell wall biosynthesis
LSSRKIKKLFLPESRPLRILLLHNRYRQRGGEDVCVDALEHLLKTHGQEVRLIEANNEEIDSSAAVLKAAAGWIHSHKWKAMVTAEIRSFRPDVAHVHNVFPLLSPSVIYACNEEGVPVVQTLHNYRLLCPSGTLFRAGKVCESCVKSSFPWPGVLHRCYRQSALGTAVVGAGSSVHRLLATYSHRVDRFIALTEFAKAKFVSANLPAEKFEVIPNWLAHDPGPGDGRGGFFLLVGRLSPEKGLGTLLDAWSRLNLPANLKIVGTGPLESDVAAASQRGIGIEHLGFLASSDVLRLMQQATAIVVPSQCYEGLPMTVIEAYAAGTPVIASRLGSLEELVIEGNTGLLFPAQDADTLARKIEWMIAHPQLLPPMRKAARREYEQRYTSERGYELLMNLYGSVAGKSVEVNA